ncbi:hypothetical protein [Kitasatospora sp. NPDC093102]|uniref:hypothetical protein n=1 Tax=Kitasatospora sp. NPDC093102 TaxID=3155069 RepID=UPI003446A702
MRDPVAHAPSRNPWTEVEAERLVRDWIDHHQETSTLLAHLQANTPYTPTTAGHGRIDHPEVAHPVFARAARLLEGLDPKSSRDVAAKRLGVNEKSLSTWMALEATGEKGPGRRRCRVRRSARPGAGCPRRSPRTGWSRSCRS